MRKSLFARGSRVLAAMAVAVLAALGLAQPASAAGSWQPVNWTGYTPCSLTYHTYDDINVKFQACTVVSGHYMQIVAVVANYSNHSVSVSADVDSFVDGSHGIHDACGTTPLAAGSRQACYGTTRYIPCGSEIEGETDIYFTDQFYVPPPPDHSPC